MSKVETPFDVNVLLAMYADCADHLDKSGKLDLSKYSKCMRELLKVFSGLGIAFSFAFSDLDTKTKHIETVLEDPRNNDIDILIDMDIAQQNIIPNDGKAGMSNMRALNRMAFVSLFVQEIFDRLQKTDNSLKSILQESYALTLELYHAWLVKKTVQSAFTLSAPSRENFLKSINVSQEQLNMTPIYIVNSQKIVDHIKAAMEKRDLPWIFA